jgi:hypothetical protein
MPKRRAATPDSEKAAVQNAHTAAGQQMTQLAHDLYGLTEDAIKLGELPAGSFLRPTSQTT